MKEQYIPIIMNALKSARKNSKIKLNNTNHNEPQHILILREIAEYNEALDYLMSEHKRIK